MVVESTLCSIPRNGQYDLLLKSSLRGVANWAKRLALGEATEKLIFSSAKPSHDGSC